jgi:hypothetical protein
MLTRTSRFMEVKRALYETLPSIFTTITSSFVKLDLCNGIGYGTAVNARIGNIITCKRFVLDCTLAGGQANLATDDRYNTVRVVMYSATPGNSQTPSLSQCLEPRLIPGWFDVFLDRTIILESPGKDSTGYMPAVRRLKFDIPLRERIMYTGSTGTQSGKSLFLGFISDSGVAPSPGILSGFASLLYEDI